MAIKTLSEFYSLMQFLRDVRYKITLYLIQGKQIKEEDIENLENIKIGLESISKKNGKFVLQTLQGNSIEIELDYELNELSKDEIFLKSGHEELMNHMSTMHKDFKIELEAGLKFIKQKKYEHFITDRDGTISNYCGRYQSSIQPIYNAKCLSEFQKNIEGRSVILTSAPLKKIGITDVSIQPEGEYILAGSKGREMLLNGKIQSYPMTDKEKDKLHQLNEAIEKLLNQKEFAIFRYIGSGIQYKFGQTAIARQDKNESIAVKKSLALKTKIESIIKKIDLNREFFSLEDTGKDLEITLNIKSADNNSEEFDKGQGLKFIMKQLNENIGNKNVLVCGDTFSDVPLITAAKALGAKVTSIFVTEDENLKDIVSANCKNVFFVSSPDVLIYMLYKYS